MSDIKLTLQQQRVIKILQRLIDYVKVELDGEEDGVELFSQDLEDMLDLIQAEDGFGTEAQTDPRGDFRNGIWSMWNVEGVDVN